MPLIAPLKSRHKIPLPGALLEQWNGIIFNFLQLIYIVFLNLLIEYLQSIIFYFFFFCTLIKFLILYNILMNFSYIRVSSGMHTVVKPGLIWIFVILLYP